MYIRSVYVFLIVLLVFSGCKQDDMTDPDCTVGTSCDDSDADTYNDVYDADCNCAGTLNMFTDDRDGQSYQTLKIGTQTWMAENLNYDTGNSWCFDNNSSNCNTYGRLYDWNTAINACPAGWHLPSDNEWKTLEIFLGMSQAETDVSGWRGTDEGGKMKEAGVAHWISPNTGATNSSGFSGLPGSSYGFIGYFGTLGLNWGWWSATETSPADAWYRDLKYDNAFIGRFSTGKGNGFSVRCIRD